MLWLRIPAIFPLHQSYFVCISFRLGWCQWRWLPRQIRCGQEYEHWYHQRSLRRRDIYFTSWSFIWCHLGLVPLPSDSKMHSLPQQVWPPPPSRVHFWEWPRWDGWRRRGGVSKGRLPKQCSYGTICHLPLSKRNPQLECISYLVNSLWLDIKTFRQKIQNNQQWWQLPKWCDCHNEGNHCQYTFYQVSVLKITQSYTKIYRVFCQN